MACSGRPRVDDQEVADDASNDVLERQIVWSASRTSSSGCSPAASRTIAAAISTPTTGRAPLSRAGRHKPWARGEDRHTGSGPDVGGVEERLDEAACDPPEQPVVAVGPGLSAPALRRLRTRRCRAQAVPHAHATRESVAEQARPATVNPVVNDLVQGARPPDSARHRRAAGRRAGDRRRRHRRFGVSSRDLEAPEGPRGDRRHQARRGGRTHRLSLEPDVLSDAADWMDRQRALWAGCSTQSMST